MEEPEGSSVTDASRTRTPVWKRIWFWGVIALVLAALVGIGIGASLGSRQGGPLSSNGATGARPTILVATAAPSASPSVLVAAVPSPSPLATAVVASGATSYVVQPGDTLRSIADAQYGDASQWPRIYDANRDAIGPDPDALIAGTKLTIPR